MSKLFDQIQNRVGGDADQAALTAAQLAPPNCDTACSPSQPADAPNPFRRDGLLQVYCWALIHGPKLPRTSTVPRPAHSPERWTHEAHRQQWDNGVLWACQSIRCITRAQLQGDLGRPLNELMEQIRGAPRPERVKILTRRSARIPTDRSLLPLPMRRAEVLTRIAEHKLDARRRNEHIWPRQQAFWAGVRAAALHYTLAWQSDASPSRPDEAMVEWYAEGVSDAMFFGIRTLI